MDKLKTLEAVKNARKSHESQMAKIEAVINGHTVDTPTVVSKSKCNFGLWLYDDENHIKEILGSQFYDKIEFLHAQWHTEYTKIFEIFFKEEKKGFFEKILGSKKKVEGMELDKAKLYHENLLITTKELLKVLVSSERRIEAMSESKFS